GSEQINDVSDAEDVGSTLRDRATDELLHQYDHIRNMPRYTNFQHHSGSRGKVISWIRTFIDFFMPLFIGVAGLLAVINKV
ncbi:MAG: hypothetical protein QGE95_14350, partial [Arenicellales bacterium]|nr:hypothetical protein [Arenicellales bacterium]